MHGILVNSGGTVAPGDVGTPGLTTITGGYNVTSTNAALDIDIGGPTQATLFQNPGEYYDYLHVTGSATIGGALNVGLINGYVPASGTNFNVLQSGNVISGSFRQRANGGLLLPIGNNAVFRHYYGNVATAAGFNPDYVTVTTLVGSNGGVWINPVGDTWDTGSNWGNGVSPYGNGAGAFFGSALLSSGTVTMPNDETVGTLSFLNTAASYTVAPVE